MNHFYLYHHKSKRFAEYVYEFSKVSSMVSDGIATYSIENLPNNNSTKFAELPEELRKLLFFAKPDVIICYDNGLLPIRPVFAFELTNHVPARDHWLQRFNNLVGCAQIGVPGAYVLPFDLSLRPSFAGKLDSAFFYGYDRVMEIHRTPFYIAEWESSDKANLDLDSLYSDLPAHDSEPIKKAFAFLNKVMDSVISGLNIELLLQDRLIVDLRDDIRKKAYTPIPQIQDFERLAKNMPNNGFLTWIEVVAWLSKKGITIPRNLPDRIAKRQRNLIFTPIADQRGRRKNSCGRV